MKNHIPRPQLLSTTAAFTEPEGEHTDSGVPKLALSIEQACQASDLGKTTLYQLLASGQLRSRKIGRRRLILFSDLRECLQASPTE
jgi:excisionase family DNA binding protein